MQPDVFIPTLHTFAMNNIFTGSWGEMRFRVEPSITMLNPKEVDMENSSMTAEYWHGPYCYEMSEMEGKETFPMSEEGRTNMKNWLDSHV